MNNQPTAPAIATLEAIQSHIYEIRGVKVMLDRDLATLYNVETKRLKEQVKRNMSRFPSDAMFTLTKEEYDSLRSQIATSNGRGGTRYMPYAFTELGVSMLSSVLNSDVAIQINLNIMRAFVLMRNMLQAQKEIENIRLEIINQRQYIEGSATRPKRHQHGCTGTTGCYQPVTVRIAKRHHSSPSKAYHSTRF